VTDLTPDQVRIIGECLLAVGQGPFLPERETPALIGLRRDEPPS
jgi:hypothetical protein